MKAQNIDPSRLAYFDQQKALYELMRAELVRDHLGEFIAFENSQVLDHDFNEQELAKRVYERYGYRDLLIRQVWLEEPRLSVASVIHSADSLMPKASKVE
jgi:hypothetical protein